MLCRQGMIFIPQGVLFLSLHPHIPHLEQPPSIHEVPNPGIALDGKPAAPSHNFNVKSIRTNSTNLIKLTFTEINQPDYNYIKAREGDRFGNHKTHYFETSQCFFQS
jgi:hypothetical protein